MSERSESAETTDSWWEDKAKVRDQIVAQAGLLCSKLDSGAPYGETVKFIWRLFGYLSDDDDV